MKIKFYDTKDRKKKPFEPLDPKNIKFYVCGPTVYDRAHIGNARPAVVFDVLFRFLRYIYGSKHVTYVRNFTDIDDKINRKAVELKRSIKSITDQTIDWYESDMKTLNVLSPTKSPRATEYVNSMINQIKVLLENKNAYLDGQGHVLFSVKSFPQYGALSKRRLEEMRFGARVEVGENKLDPMDFVLWKPSDVGLPGWDSPWGRGRPGWHIECSAMIFELLGLNIDIHGGGVDLVFPHHENEIAQSLCAHPHSTFANFWMHNGYLQIEGKKMSKSLNNFFTVNELTSSGLNGTVIRMMLMSTHYRQPLDWTENRVSELSATIKKWTDLAENVSPAVRPSKNILNAIADDINTPKAISELHHLFSKGDLPLFLSSASFLGILLDRRSKNFVKNSLNSYELEKIEELIEKRRLAKKQKDFKTADNIRDMLSSFGISIKDNVDGSEWEITRDFCLTKLRDEI